MSLAYAKPTAVAREIKEKKDLINTEHTAHSQ